MVANINRCQPSVIPVKRQVKAASRASGSQGPWLPGVQKHCQRCSGNVLMAIAILLTHGLILKFLL